VTWLLTCLPHDFPSDLVLISFRCPDPISDAEFWHKVALRQLEKTIKQAQRVKEDSYQKKARNIIIFIGDGMGISTISAGRIYKGQYLKHGYGEEETLAFDDFPNTGMAKVNAGFISISMENQYF